METNRLRYFCTIAEMGSLTKASEVLGVTHSGLSKAISVLEAEIGLKLFRPQGRGLEITIEGKWFYKKAQDILQIENDIQKGLQKDHLFIRIGLSEVLALICASDLAEEIAGPISFIVTDLGEIEARIIAGEIDFGVAFSISPKPELEYLEIAEVKFNSYARSDLLEKSIAEEIPYVVPEADFVQNPLGYRSRDAWPKDVSRKPYYTASGFSVGLNLLESGLAAMYIPDFVALIRNKKKLQNLQIVKAPHHKKIESKRKIFLIKSKSIEESIEMKKLSKVIRRLCL